MRREQQLDRHGLGVSHGIAIGRAVVTSGHQITIPRRTLGADECEGELGQLAHAVEQVRMDLERDRDRAMRELGEDPARILEAHLLMLDDEYLIGAAAKAIEGHRVNAAWALAQVIDRLTERFRELRQEGFRERARDVQDVGERLLRAIAGIEPGRPEPEEEYILVAHDPAPSDIARLQRSRALGMAVDAGGRTSHLGIIAKGLEIPAVVGLGTITQEVQTGDQMIVDGTTGRVFVRPTAQLLAEYEDKKTAYEVREESLRGNRSLPAVTADGCKVFLQANVDFPDEVEAAEQRGAEGIGLYRSEFLFVNSRQLPTEDEQFEVYRRLAERAYPQSAIVRTIDFGGGKVKPPGESMTEPNPILGLRAIRYCRRHPEVFKTQLRALLRASAHGRLKVMFPLISSVSELWMAKETLNQAKEELRQDGLSFNDELSVGIMIEVPAAAAVADLLARECDFFSIGTNDLIQFLLAIDRDNTEVSYLYEPLHPAVLRTIRYVIEAGHSAGIRVGMCGEMAAEPRYVPLLVGLGLDELSMNPVSIPHVKNIIRSVKRSEAAAMAEHVLNLATAKEIEDYLEEQAASRSLESSV